MAKKTINGVPIETFNQLTKSLKDKIGPLENLLSEYLSPKSIEYLRRWTFEYASREIELNKITNRDCKNSLYIARKYELLQDYAYAISDFNDIIFQEGNAAEDIEMQLYLPTMRDIDELIGPTKNTKST